MVEHEPAYRVMNYDDAVVLLELGNYSTRCATKISTMPNTIRASVVQTCTASFNLSDTLQKFENLTKLAKHRDDTQLVVFSEAL